MTRIFSTGEPRKFLERESELLSKLQKFLAELGWGEHAQKVEGLVHGLGEPFLFVVVGEYNAGKSRFINAILGERLLAEGVIPTTDAITVVYFDEGERPAGVRDGVRLVPSQHEYLRDINIVDTPGTNSIIRKHRDTTESYIHRAELVLFVISAVQPFSESERAFLEFIRGRWDRKVVFIVNKTDLIEPGHLPVILDFVEKNTYNLLHFEPLIFTLSAKDALAGKLNADQALLESSGLPKIEDYIFKTLSSDEKILLKLRSPLKSAEHICDELVEALVKQIAALRLEEEKLERLFIQLRDRQAEVKDYFGKYRAEIDRVFFELKGRVHRFIQERLTSIELARTRIMGKNLDDEFRREILQGGSTPLAGLPAIIEEAIDYVTRNNRKQWDFSLTYLRDTLGESRSYVSAWEADFDERRRQMLDSTRQAAEQFQKFDVDAEAQHIRTAAQEGLQRFIVLEGVAVAGGIGLVAILNTMLLDFTGLLFATAIGVMGFYVLPRKRAQAVAEFDRRLDELSSGLRETLTRQLEKAVDHVTEEIEQNVKPLQGLSRQERRQAEERREHVAALIVEVRAMEDDVQRRFGAEA
jgi:ribosome biogenesis GTPase A